MKKLITFLYLISGSLLTSLLWVLQEIKDDNKDCYLVQNGLCIGVTISSIVLLIGLYYSYLTYNSDGIVLDKWVHMLLRHILDQYLANDNYNTRLTIFKPKIGWKTWGKYICQVILGNIVENSQNKKLLLSFKNFPIHGRTMYLQQHDRVTSSKCPRSMTIFKTTVRGEELNGIADECFREDKDRCFAQADSLNEIEIPKKYPTDNDASSVRIRNYMEAMKIGRNHYDVLRGMNFRTKQLLAFPLRKPDDSIWGIVVVDTDDDFGQTLDDILKEHIGDYQVMFRSMCKSL